jgi:hypothetical protein
MRKISVLKRALSAIVVTPVYAANLVNNDSVENTTMAGKNYFAGHVDGWNGGGNLTFIAPPGTADDEQGFVSLYGPFPRSSPDGGNFVTADGDPSYRDAIWQTIAGLTIGSVYELSFFQAAGQWTGRAWVQDTTERWQVSFGDETKGSDSYHLPFAGVGPWQLQTMHFTATSTSQVLSFLADGTPSGAPPMSLLDGVSPSKTALPEPSNWALLLTGFAAVGGAMRARRRERQSTALV